MLAVIVLEIIDISVRINSDEREAAHEALSERNAAWTMVVMLVGGIVFQAIASILHGQLHNDWTDLKITQLYCCHSPSSKDYPFKLHPEAFREMLTDCYRQYHQDSEGAHGI